MNWQMKVTLLINSNKDYLQYFKMYINYIRSKNNFKT